MATRSLERVLAGTVVDEESADYRARTIQPGLAVDPDGRRAFVVPADGPVAEIGLETLTVAYHELERSSLLSRFLSWLVPAAQAKVLEGPVREARWLGDGLIGVSGLDYSLARSEDGRDRVTAEAIGLSLIDTGSWREQELDGEASGLTVATGLVIAQGGGWDSRSERFRGPGLRAFGPDGSERWRLYSREQHWIAPVGAVGYVSLGTGRMDVVDLATGAIVARLTRSDRSWPQLLAAQTSDW